MFVMQWIQLCH